MTGGGASSCPGPTVAAQSADLARGRTTGRALTAQALAVVEDAAGEARKAFIRVLRQEALAAADASDLVRTAGSAPPLAGIPVSVKDLFDIAGLTTLAGSATRRDEPAAAADAVVVARLRAAGAVIIGTTNMTEFAMGGLGLNPHFGDCRNPWDRATGRIPGGSSSGAAVAVAEGAVTVSLGTDTMGSIRIPAALCGLVGFKPTARRVPLAGAYPLSPTLDSIGPLARSVACCALVDAVLSGGQACTPDPMPLPGLRLGVPRTLVLDALDEAVAQAFQRALARLAAAGARIEEFDFPELAEIAELNRRHSLTAIESYAIHRDWLATHGSGYDPRVRERIVGGADASAADYFHALSHRQVLIERAARRSRIYDAVAMPTVPVVAPPIALFTGTDEALRNGYSILVRNTAAANHLDRCALSLPCHAPEAAPVGLMLMGEHLADRRLLGIGMSIERCLAERA